MLLHFFVLVGEKGFSLPRMRPLLNGLFARIRQFRIPSTCPVFSSPQCRATSIIETSLYSWFFPKKKHAEARD